MGKSINLIDPSAEEVRQLLSEASRTGICAKADAFLRQLGFQLNGETLQHFLVQSLDLIAGGRFACVSSPEANNIAIFNGDIVTPTGSYGRALGYHDTSRFFEHALRDYCNFEHAENPLHVVAPYTVVLHKDAVKRNEQVPYRLGLDVNTISRV